MKKFEGSCHCGRIRFEITTDLSCVSECNCSICRPKGYLHHMVTPEHFRLLSGEGELSTYQFGTMQARHHFCRVCGVAVFFRPRANPSNYMVNVRCLAGVDLSQLQPVQFDGRSWESRLGAPYEGPWKPVK